MTDLRVPEVVLRRPGPRVATVLVAIGLAALAVAARLVPVLRGGGLTGLGNYDDGVYFSAGTALCHGVLPYRNYLFLHPPGIIMLLAPFGLAGLTGHDAAGLAAARMAWMLLGAVNTLLVARILRPVGLLATLTGAVFYATAFPAIYIEWTPLLEGPAQTCVLMAVVLLTRGVGSSEGTRLTVLAAGALLGLSVTFKIWGVVALATVLLWYGVRGRLRSLARIGIGAAVAIAAVCLPFFIAAPVRMWQMVVIDQVQRIRTGPDTWHRLSAVVDLGLHGRFVSLGAPLVAALLIMLVVLVAAARVPSARLCLCLTASLTALVIAGPSWFLHYPGLVTGPLAVAIGAGTGVLIGVITRRRRWAGIVATAVVVVTLAVAAAPLLTLRLGRTFPAAELKSGVGGLKASPTCLVADDPTAMIALNVLSRDLDHGCTFVADLGGYSYQLAAERGHWVPRVRDEQWQRVYLRYLRSGDLAMSYHYATLRALDPSTLAVVSSWPVVSSSGRYALREPR